MCNVTGRKKQSKYLWRMCILSHGTLHWLFWKGSGIPLVFKAMSFVPELSFKKYRQSVDVWIGRWVSGMLRAFSNFEASCGCACPWESQGFVGVAAGFHDREASCCGEQGCFLFLFKKDLGEYFLSWLNKLKFWGKAISKNLILKTTKSRLPKVIFKRLSS